MLSPRLRVLTMIAFLVPSACVLGNSFLEETQRKASQGDIEAQRTLAYLYGSGKGVSRNDFEAGKWRAAVFNQEAGKNGTLQTSDEHRSPLCHPVLRKGFSLGAHPIAYSFRKWFGSER